MTGPTVAGAGAAWGPLCLKAGRLPGESNQIVLGVPGELHVRRLPRGLGSPAWQLGIQEGQPDRIL